MPYFTFGSSKKIDNATSITCDPCSEIKIAASDTYIMQDFIIIALLGFLLLASYVQYTELRDIKKNMIVENKIKESSS
jgi:hypothetical protein